MTITYPHTIENCIGEKLIVHSVVPEPDGDRLLVENFVAPGVGPLMHTHWKQDECLTVMEGRIGYQVKGGPEQFAGPGETVLFERGVPHRFWNAGTETLHCTGYIKPAHTVVYFLTAIFNAQNKTGTGRPELFDAAFLTRRYASEFHLNDMPFFVRKVVIPATYFLGKLLGRYAHFKDAPEPVK
ncbi:MAG TPA: cupin domain-containing protein [Chitinophagaceae bacterium]|jgi:quercetin dioxygenase-like cupin family protein|nr:cupin domain-containing protein [Chitinophagaceae bacterium]